MFTKEEEQNAPSPKDILLDLSIFLLGVDNEKIIGDTDKEQFKKIVLDVIYSFELDKISPNSSSTEKILKVINSYLINLVYSYKSDVEGFNFVLKEYLHIEILFLSILNVNDTVSCLKYLHDTLVTAIVSASVSAKMASRIEIPEEIEKSEKSVAAYDFLAANECSQNFFLN